MELLTHIVIYTLKTMIYHQWYGDQTCSTHNKGCNFAYRKSRHNIKNWDEHDTITFIIINN
jgi:hypothetical protein